MPDEPEVLEEDVTPIEETGSQETQSGGTNPPCDPDKLGCP